MNAAAPAPRRGLWLAALLAAALIAAYALAGFLLLPWLVQRELPRYVEQNLHQRARIGQVSFNPFTLRLQARGLSIETPAGRPLLGFGEAALALDWRSLLRRAWVLGEVSLTNPAVHVEIEKDGRLNLAALAPGADSGAEMQAPRFAIARLSVVNGSVGFDDLRQGYRNRIEQLTIEIDSLSTLGDEPGSYALQGQTPQGTKLSWKGSATLAPLSASGTLALENLALAELMPYVGERSPLHILAGHARMELPYTLRLAQGELRYALKGAKLDLHGLILARRGKTAQQANIGPIAVAGIDFDSGTQHVSVKTARVGPAKLIPGKNAAPLATSGAIALDGVEFGLGTRRGAAHKLSLAGATLGAAGEAKSGAALGQLGADAIAFDLGTQRVSAKTLRLSDFKLTLARDAKGGLDLLQGLDGGGPARADAPAKWQADIAAIEVGNASVRYTDRTAKTPLALALDGMGGNFSLNAAADGEGVRLRIDAPRLALARIEAAAAAPAPGTPSLRVANLSLAGARYDSAGKALAVEAVRIGSLGAQTRLENGHAALLDLLPAFAAAKSDKPLSARAGTIELMDGSIDAADRDSGIALALQRISVRLRNASSDPGQTLSFDASAELASGGRVALNGRAVPARGRASVKLEASKLALAPLRPLLQRFASVKLVSGAASLSGRLRFGGKQAKLVYSGSAAINDLALDDPSGGRLFGWKSLASDAIEASLSPDRISIDELRLLAPAGRLAIAKDGTSNLSRAFATERAVEKSGVPPPAAPAGANAGARKDAAKNAVEVSVRRVRVEQGRLDFSDESLSPEFLAKIVDLAGTANGLSSDREARSQFALEGSVDEFGYARLSGSANPFEPRDRSNFRVQLRNIDLTTVSPYSMRFAGYRIASGHMSLDLNYRVRDSLIEGSNKITLEKIALGERVDSPDALDLPFQLAIALLKDPDGTISLDLPVKGNLDDPQFSLAPLIWKAVGNLIGNIVAAPFRALGQLFGGSGGDLEGSIAFEAGGNRLLPPELEKLARMAEALAKRPELKLEIPAHFDSEADAQALKRAALERDILRRAGFALAEDEAPGRINMDDDKTRSALRALFAERLGKAEYERLRAEAEAKARAAKLPEPSVAERVRNFAGGAPQISDAREFYRTLLRRLREAQPLPPSALAELGRQRALAIEAALRSAGADPARLLTITDTPGAVADARQVEVQLRLATR